MASRTNPVAMSTYQEMQMHNSRNIRTPYPSASKLSSPQGHNPRFDQERECMFLLQQVQEGVDIGWIDNVMQSLQDQYQANVSPFHNQEELHQLSRCTSNHSRHSYLSGTTVASSSNWQPLTQPSMSAVSLQEEPYLDDESHFHLYPASAVQNLGQPTSSPYQGTPLLNPGTADLSTFSSTSWLDVPAIHTPVTFLDDNLSSYEAQPDLVPTCSIESYASQDYLYASSYYNDSMTTSIKREQEADCNDASLQLPKAHASPQWGQTPSVLLNTGKSHFIDYKRPPPSKSGYRSPCPLCDKTFISSKEFILHMKAHDQQIEFFCLHPVPSRQGARTCGYKTWRRAQMTRHHTDHHRECNLPSLDPKATPACRRENHNAHPKRVWGCWFCTCATYSVDSWVSHHMKQHVGMPRKLMSTTSLIKSLLSQNLLRDLWQTKVEQLEVSEGRTYDLRWSDEPNDVARDELIGELELGFWGRHDFHTDPGARQSIVETAMDATALTRISLGPAFRNDDNCVKRPPTSSPPGIKPCRTRSFSRPFGLRTSKSKPNLKQQAPPVPDQNQQTEVSRPATSHSAGTLSLRGHRHDHAMSRNTSRPLVGTSYEDQT